MARFPRDTMEIVRKYSDKDPALETELAASGHDEKLAAGDAASPSLPEN
jgi:hypothetical protein